MGYSTSKDETLAFASRISQMGFRVYIAKSGTYGFITDESESRVLSFSFADLSASLSGNYGPPSRESGTGLWRRTLEQIAEGDAFAELINFADNEGVIGPIVSAKLAKDFAAYQGHIATLTDASLGTDADWFREKFGEWRKAFEMASDGGAVNFH